MPVGEIISPMRHLLAIFVVFSAFCAPAEAQGFYLACRGSMTYFALGRQFDTNDNELSVFVDLAQKRVVAAGVDYQITHADEIELNVEAQYMLDGRSISSGGIINRVNGDVTLIAAVTNRPDLPEYMFAVKCVRTQRAF